MTPPPASGVKLKDYMKVKDQDDGYITWLLEPIRNASTTKKWSGTMNHPSHTNKVGDTLHAFVHFAYQSEREDSGFQSEGEDSEDVH
ncbi:hypothetical protein VKT23_018052 [Stygiomarasmius scandens]|uniref:Alpha-type protein kinase domain-containing protein n=1 Tax=Marasmiellus scandens TaxID=2682957 RepID=A0ABR1IQB7_9AGAR